MQVGIKCNFQLFAFSLTQTFSPSARLQKWRQSGFSHELQPNFRSKLIMESKEFYFSCLSRSI